MGNLKTKKVIALTLVASLVGSYSGAFAQDDTVSSLVPTTSLSSQSGSTYVGEKELDSILADYENTLKNQNQSDKIEKFSKEKSLLKQKKLSDELKEDILAKQFDKQTKKQLKALAGGNEKNTSSLISSMKKDKKGAYRLLVKTSLSLAELKSTVQFFDTAEITLQSTETDGKNIYQVLLPYKGKFAKYIGGSIENFTLPDTLLGSIEIIKPQLVKLDADSTYLSGESLSQMWGMTKIGAQNYQQKLSSLPKVKVGVIDTGISITHPDLQANIYTNTNEIAGNGVDDDNNGYIDDVNGFNFVNVNGNAQDDHGHGTHVAGVIGGKVNGKGIFGVESNAQLVPLKVLDANGYGSTYAIIDALDYATKNGIKIVNMSLGGTGTPSSDPLCSAITQAKKSGVLTVVAAGNENTDTSTKVPAGCTNALTVSAVDQNLNKASFSNYGTKVELAAPGVSIYSSVLNNSYASWNGTSMATPFVAGLASSVLAVNTQSTPDMIQQTLINNADTLSQANIGKMINMSKTMTALGISPDTQSGTTQPPTTSTGITQPPTSGSGSTGTGTTSSGNILPILNVAVVKNALNNYTLTASGSDSDGSIVGYTFKVNDVIVSTGGTTYTTTITKDTSVVVGVIDNLGGTAYKSVFLKYEAPVVNKLPQVSLVGYRIAKNTYMFQGYARDLDGKIVSTQYLLNNEIIGSGTSQKVVITKDSTVIFRVTDNLGGVSEKSLSLKYEINKAPVVSSFVSYKTSLNKYTVVSQYYDPDGTISSASISQDGTVLNVKPYYFSLEITKNTTITLKLVDNEGAVTEKSLNLVYEAPKPNVAPKLTLTQKSVNKYYNTVQIFSQDTDGKIVKVEYNYNGKNYSMPYYGPSVTFNLYYLVNKGETLTVKVTDDKGAVTQQSITVK